MRTVMEDVVCSFTNDCQLPSLSVHVCMRACLDEKERQRERMVGNGKTCTIVIELFECDTFNSGRNYMYDVISMF